MLNPMRFRQSRSAATSAAAHGASHQPAPLFQKTLCPYRVLFRITAFLYFYNCITQTPRLSTFGSGKNPPKAEKSGVFLCRGDKETFVPSAFRYRETFVQSVFRGRENALLSPDAFLRFKIRCPPFPRRAEARAARGEPRARGLPRAATTRPQTPPSSSPCRARRLPSRA